MYDLIKVKGGGCEVSVAGKTLDLFLVPFVSSPPPIFCFSGDDTNKEKS